MVTRGLKGAVCLECAVQLPIPPRNSKPGLSADPHTKHPQDGQGFRSVSAEFSVVLTLVFGAKETVIGGTPRFEGDLLSDLVGGRHWLGY